MKHANPLPLGELEQILNQLQSNILQQLKVNEHNLFNEIVYDYQKKNNPTD